MNKIKYIIQILIVVTLLGCTDEEIFKSKSDIEVIAGFAKTRTTFIEDNGTTHVEWEVGDAIGLFTNEQNNLQYTALSNGNEIKFSTIEEKLKANEGEKVFAYYPYSYDNYEDGKLIIPVMTGQNYNKNASEADFIYAVNQVKNGKLLLQFKHIFAFLKITLPLDLLASQEKYGELEIEASEDISFTGKGYIDMENGEVVLDEKRNYLRYYIPINEELQDKKEITCYIAILPQKAGTELKIYTRKDKSSRDCLLTKKVSESGFKAGNVYTVYLNENETEVIRKRERDALIAFYKATNGDNWKNNTNWCSDKPINEWYGVSIWGSSGTIQTIALMNNNLTGIIPEEIGQFNDISALVLSGNFLTGSIPSSLGNLTSLNQSITLRNNRLTGSIPSSLGNLVNLKGLYLGNNKLTGSIPPEIGNMTSLEDFSISNVNVGAEGGDIEWGEDTGISKNQISGPIPIELCRLPNLISFGADRNKLSGEIPNEIWSLPCLENLTLSENQLTGKISPDIRNAENLKQLWLGNNLLTGTLPEEIYELTKLEELHLGNVTNNMDGSPIQEYNHFAGNLSDKIRNLVNLRELRLESAGFSGELPNSIGELGNLETLNIHNNSANVYNSFVGTIPESVGYLKKLKFFTADNVGLTGKLPNSIFHLTNLVTLSLGNVTVSNIFNSFSGEISEDIGNLRNLEHLSLMGNNFEGNIPETLADLPKLQSVFLENNRLSGLVPYKLSQSPQWKSWNPEVWILPQQEGYILSVEHYTSTDFSKDGEVITLQDHTKGNGIKLVLMGDAFVDTDMEYGGKYETMMKKAMERYFSVEPFKSLREYYDVVCIKAVSKNDWIGKETAFEAKYGDGTYIGGNNDKCMEYAQKALGINSVDDVQVITVLNDSKYAGTCHMYSNGFSIAYCPYVNNSDQSFGEMIHHEANGHGFGFLGDEYAYEGVISLSEIEDATNLYTNYGWYANIDFTSNPSQVKWNYFISDSRYTNEEIGVYEGGLTYSQGVYRPTETSIMVDNTGQFNAPSREAIYKRAMKIANGNSWVYNYEDFVLFDAPARTATRAIKHYQPRKDFKPTVPPVIYNYPAVAK